VHDVDALQRLDLGQVKAQRLKRALEFGFRPVRNFAPRLVAAHVQAALVVMLAAPAMHLDLDFPGQLPAQIINVNSGASVDVRRILSRE
jgi:hypothetical protein